MQDYVDVNDTHKKILPVPYPANPAPSNPEGVNYGKDMQPMPLSPYPNSKNDMVQYCNELPAAPRSQDLNVPYQGPNCPYYPKDMLNYKKDACYLTNDTAQGIVGLVCNNAGGSDNANFVRGNQFGAPYDLLGQSEQFKRKKKLVYEVNPPVQLKMELENPLVIYDKNTFYPQPDWPLHKDPNYKTYMNPDDFTKNGLPTYQFPDKVINPMRPLTRNEYIDKMEKKNATNDPVISDYPNNVPYDDFKLDLLENDDIQNGKRSGVIPSANSKNNISTNNSFLNMTCPHRKNCDYCKNCPYGPQCKCGSNCPYCSNCEQIKSLVLDHFENMSEDQKIYCPMRMACPSCRNCPNCPNCGCGFNCPICRNCPFVQANLKLEQKNNLMKFVTIILIIVLILVLIYYFNSYKK